MKYKRILTGALALALALPLLIPSAQAHPGRTDANGGHTNHDSGEYHYHHGHEAHAHYDMDGDGEVDCPFDFVDKTGWNSGISSGNSQGYSVTSPYYGSYATLPQITMPNAELETLPEFPTLPSREVAVQSRYSAQEYPPEFSAYIAVCLVLFFITYPLVMRYDRFKESGRKRWVWATWISSAALIVLTSPLFLGVLVFSSPVTVPYLAYRIYVYYQDQTVQKRRDRELPSETHRKPQSPSSNEPKPTPENSRQLPAQIPATVSSDHETPKHLHPDLQEGLCGYAALNADIPPCSPKTQTKPAQDVERPKPQCSPIIPDDSFITPDPEIVFHFAPGLDPAVSVHARCRDTCHYLWYETLLVRSSTSPPLSSNSTIYIWTALFYTAVKTLRSQGAVDRIYDYFREATGKFVTEEKYRYLVVMKVREVYRSIRPLLNNSEIDPRTNNGRRDLWFLIAECIPEAGDPQLQKEFEAASQRVWQTIADVFPQAQPYPKAGDIRYSIDDLPETP